jgi:twitching motility protein PilI
MVDNQDYFATPGQSLPMGMEAQIEAPQGELHLRFFLPSGDEFALPAAGIREVMQQEPDRITPMPNASPLLLGTVNLRGQVIWVADLGQFLGYPHLVNVDRGEIPVIAIEEQEMILGLAVEKLGETRWLDTDNLQIPDQVPDHLAPYLQGEWILKEGEDQKEQRVRLLDQIAILRSARWVA